MDRVIFNAQTSLAARGIDPGPLDGIMGRRTASALRTFQKQLKLAVTGILDGETLVSLLGDRAPLAVPLPWMQEGYRVMGLHEQRDKSALSRWLKSDGKTLGDPTKNPWCGDFQQTIYALSLPDEPLPSNPYASINWLKFGQPTEPQYGAAMVFWRGKKDGRQGHIASYVAEDDTHYLVLGGNQSNAVTLSKIAKYRLRDGGVRWPSTFKDPKAGSRYQNLDKVIATTNEA